mmetsp:Transcript_5570/g.11854  ORF Transcript_5570/g.11854 Transcript_5570/m.11854 type:complete len:242 (-) Transcript_5570:68-793(-)
MSFSVRKVKARSAGCSLPHLTSPLGAWSWWRGRLGQHRQANAKSDEDEPSSDVVEVVGAGGGKLLLLGEDLLLLRLELLLDLRVQLRGLGVHLQRLLVHLVGGVFLDGLLEAVLRPVEVLLRLLHGRVEEALRRVRVPQAPKRFVPPRVDLERALDLLYRLLDALHRLAPLLQVGELEERPAPPDEGLDILRVLLHFELRLLLGGLEEDEALQFFLRKSRTLRHGCRFSSLLSTVPPDAMK